MKRRTIRVDFGSYGVTSTIRAAKPALIVRDHCAIHVTAAEIQVGDMAVFSPRDDQRNYEELVAGGGIATLVPVVGVSPGRKAAHV